jgi:TonB-dependent starch-binding outer membrane protein SusC
MMKVTKLALLKYSKKTALRAKFAIAFIGFVLMSFIANAQNKTITGKVVDEKTGNPLSSANVEARGTNINVRTEADGTFSISVPTKVNTLVVSYVGYDKQEVSIGSALNYTITLTAIGQKGEEVVVVGYGTQKKKSVTASQAKINTNEFNTLVTTSIDKQLGGRAAGIQVTNSSGLVNQAPRIRIRGVNSISQGRDPLIVLDGVPTYSGGFSGVANTNALADINPADIESIDVLKDGSATAIYGSRAANGVILITTKKGKQGRSNVNYSSTFGFAKPFQRFDLLNAQDFVTVANEKLTNASLAAAAFLDPNATNTDWQSVVLRSQALSQIHSLGIDGGNERTSYFISFNYSNQEGLITTNFAKRYGARINIDHKVNNWLKVGNNITISRTEDNDQNNGSNALSGAVAAAMRSLPNVSPFASGNFGGYNVLADGSALGRGANTRTIENNYSNIAFVLNNNKFSSIKNRVISNAFLEVKPLSNLTYKFVASIDYNTAVDFQGLDPRHGDGRGSSGSVFNQSLNRNRYILQNIINYNKSFGQHTIGAVVGNELQRDQNSAFNGQGTNISDIFFLDQNVITGSYVNQFSGGSYSKSGFASYFGRVNYDYKNKYFAQASLRRDGQSSLAPDKRFGTFPGFSAGWRVSEEDFWKNSKLNNIIDEFKIRGGYAEVGNTLGGFPYLSTYGSSQYGGLNGIAVNLVGNADLIWETNKKINVGADLSLFKNRINLTFDWYQNKNDNLVLDAPLPVSFGIPNNSVSRNIGNMENKGIELTISGTIIKKRDFSWDANINYTTVKNSVNALYLNQDVFGTYNILRVGQPINALFGYEFAGVNSANGNPLYNKADGSLVQGNIANSTYYLATKGSATLGAASTLGAGDRKVLGNVIPTFYGGLSNTVRYKGFTLDFLLRYSGGNYIMNITNQEALLSQGFVNNSKEILNRWTTAGQETTVPRLWYGRDNFTNLAASTNSRFVEKGDFIKLDNFSLSYELPKSLLNKIARNNIKSFRAFIQGQNIWNSTKFSGLDPDGVDELGINNATVPSARTISVGFNIGL